MKFKEIIKEEKPREKLKTLGAKNLTDSELLEILLRTGNKNESVDELSTRLLKEIGGLNKLNSMSFNMLTNIKGIKSSKASTILSALELGRRILNKEETKIKLDSSEKIYTYYKNDFKEIKQEIFYVLLYDTKMNLIERKEIYKGTVNGVDIHPREVFKDAIKESATFMIIMHNHPSGDTTPSKEDILVTERLVKIGELIGIKILDHIIISSESYYSFYEERNKIT